MVPKLTNNGWNLMVRAVNGEGITFTKIAIGNGEAPADFSGLANLQNELVSMGISEVISEEQHVILKASMSNADLEAGFYWTELGVFAQNPDGGEDILYAYGHYVITGDAAPMYIPALDSNLVDITHRVHVFVGELENVTAILTQHSTFASAADLKAHKENEENPHNVTKEQVGLGLLVNALPGDQTPVFSTTDSEYKLNDKTGKYSFTNIFSGEKVGSILQKVRTIIKLVIEHFNASNPHGVTYKKIGAAPSSHYHSTNDINSGVLGIARGGTGGGTAAEARVQLGIQSGQVTTTILAGEKHYIEVQYPTAFKERPPMVVAMPLGDAEAALEIRCTALRKNGFTAFLYSPTYSGHVTFNWIACE